MIECNLRHWAINMHRRIFPYFHCMSGSMCAKLLGGIILCERCVVMPSHQQCVGVLQPCAEGLPELERAAGGHRCQGHRPPPAVSSNRRGSGLDWNMTICAKARIPHVRYWVCHMKLCCWTGAHCVHSARTVQWTQQVQPAHQHERISDIMHAKLLRGRLQLMDGLWIVDDNVRMNDKFTVKLADSSCSCTFPNCIHLMAVRFAAGLNVPKLKRTNLSALRHRCRSSKTQAEPRAARFRPASSIRTKATPCVEV